MKLPGYWRWLLAALPLVALLLGQIAPVVRLAIEGGSLPLATVWQDDYLRWRLLWSGTQALATSALALVLGLPVAWVLARLEFPLRSAALHALMLPFVVPTLVAAMGVLALVGSGSGEAQGWQDGPWLLLYGNLFFNLCVVVRAAAEGLGQVSASRVAAARTLGATPWRTFWRVEWPAVMPAVAASLCLVFLYCFAGFGLALVLGGQRYATVEVEIYTLVAHELQLAPASALALWTLLVTGSATVVQVALVRRWSHARRSDPLPRRPPTTLAQWAAVGGALLVLAVCCWAPLLAIVLKVLLAAPAAWAVLVDPATVQALGNTLLFTAAAVLLATALGLAHALAAQRSVLLRAAASLPLVLSPISVAFGLLLLYPQWTASLALLIGAYALLAYPFVTQALLGALDALPPHLLQVARTLGASPWRLFWRVTWPLLQPALRRGMAFAAATAIGEFAVTLFLSRPEWATLTTLVYETLGRPGQANRDAALVLSTLLMALALLAFAVIERSGATRAQSGGDHA